MRKEFFHSQIHVIIRPAIKVAVGRRIFNPIHNRSVLVLGRDRWSPTIPSDSNEQFPKLSPSSHSSSLRKMRKESYHLCVTGIASVCFNPMIMINHRVIQCVFTHFRHRENCSRNVPRWNTIRHWTIVIWTRLADRRPVAYEALRMSLWSQDHAPRM